jgi:hypothetical protein
MFAKVIHRLSFRRGTIDVNLTTDGNGKGDSGAKSAHIEAKESCDGRNPSC